MASKLGAPDDSVYFEVAFRLDNTRVAAAKFAFALNSPARDVASLPAKFCDFKKQAELWLLVAGPVLQSGDDDAVDELKDMDIQA